MAVNDLSLSVQSVGHCWQRRFLLKFIFKFSSLYSDLTFINLFIGANIVILDLISYEVFRKKLPRIFDLAFQNPMELTLPRSPPQEALQVFIFISIFIFISFFCIIIHILTQKIRGANGQDNLKRPIFCLLIQQNFVYCKGIPAAITA